MANKQIFLGGEYLIVSMDDLYWSEKYEGVPTFVLEDTAENVLGKNWQEDQRPIVKVFRKRMFWKNKKIKEIKEPVLYGKCKDPNSPFRFSELVLLSEIAFMKTLDEFNEQMKFNKIKIKKL